MGVTVVSEGLTIEGATGQQYVPLNWSFVKKIGELPKFEFTLPDEDLDRVFLESYFFIRQNGVTKFKGVGVEPITFNLADQTMTITLNDYIWIMYRDYELYADFFEGYRREYDNELLYDFFSSILYDLLYCCIGEPYYVQFFGLGYYPPVRQTIRFEFESRPNGLLRVAQGCIYGRNSLGQVCTDPTELLYTDGTCDLWLDYDAPGDLTDYPGQIYIGVLGTKNVGTDLWEWITRDISNDVIVESLSELEYTHTPPSTVIVAGAGDGLNQIIGKATIPIASDFVDDIETGDKFASGLYYTPNAYDRFITTTNWSRPATFITAEYTGVVITNVYSYLLANKDFTYNSPTVKVQFKLANTNVGAGIFVEGEDSTKNWYLLVTPTSATNFHYKWCQCYLHGGVATERIVSEGDIYVSATTGVWHNLELYADMWLQQVCCYLNGNEIVWLTGYDAFTQHSGIGDRTVGLLSFFKAGAAGNIVSWNRLSVHDNRNIPPVKTECDSKFLNCLSAYKAAEKLLSEANADRSFTVEVDPTVFLDGKIDIGQRATIDKGIQVIDGTYRIMEIECTDENCTLTLQEVTT